ncbi:MAG: c-type cytochrome [Nitrospinae bacterium]|nr:c-type cytochrome [Nitrospinota bacterium]
MRKLSRIMAFMIALVPALGAPVAFADGKSLVAANKCGDCHKMAGPSAATIAEVLKRKAPDLFYAGSKFNKEWLVGYLQKPTVVRPGGVVYLNNIKTAGDTDTVGSVDKCASKLSAGDAAQVADYLMTLKDASMKAGAFKKGEIKSAQARRVLFKEQACDACHDFGKGGGLSCPTMVGAGARLNPDWMYSFIKDPVHWDPKVWMAKRDFDEATLQLIVNFLVTQ